MAEDMVSVETTNEIILLKELNHRVTALEAKFLSSQKLNTATTSTTISTIAPLLPAGC